MTESWKSLPESLLLHATNVIRAICREMLSQMLDPAYAGKSEREQTRTSNCAIAGGGLFVMHATEIESSDDEVEGFAGR
jgi:hypothetical protein